MTDPGVAVATSAVLVMVRPGTSTVTTAVQAAGAVPEAGQVAPGVVEVMRVGEGLVAGVGVVHGDGEADDGRLSLVQVAVPGQVSGRSTVTRPAVAVALLL